MRADRVTRLAPLAALLLAVLAYAPSLGGGFLWDDRLYLVANPEMGDPGGLETIWTSIGPRPFPWYPATFTSFWLEHRLWGLNPVGYRLVNLALHALNAWLVWRLGRRLGLGAAAGLAAAVFLLHPMNVETVAWIVERKNLLAAAGSLLAVLAFLRASELRDAGRAGAVLAADAGALAAFAFAMFSKTAVVALPAVLLVLSAWRRPGSLRGDLLRVLPFLAVGIALGLVTHELETGPLGASGDAFERTLLERVLVCGRVFWFYLATIVWPAGLAFFYPRWEIRADDALSWLALAAAGALPLALLAARRRLGDAPWAAVAAFALLLSPVLGFLDFYFQVYSFVADHHLYLPALPILFLLAAAAVRPALGSPVVRAAAAVGLCLALAATTASHAASFVDEETLWRTATRANPAAWMAQTNLAWILAERGELEEAERRLEAAIAANPRTAIARKNLAIVASRKGDLVRAEAELGRAIELEPGDPSLWNMRGVVRARLGESAAALADFDRAIELAPSLALARENRERTLADGWKAIGAAEGADR